MRYKIGALGWIISFPKKRVENDGVSDEVSKLSGNSFFLKTVELNYIRCR